MLKTGKQMIGRNSLLLMVVLSIFLVCKSEAGLSFEETKKAAQQGNADAQVSLGLMFEVGQGIPKDSEEAVKWYRKAAEQGNALAQFFLGNIYLLGDVPKNYREAAKWFRKAAEQGDADAQTALGWLYYDGNGVRKDLREAAEWTRKGAEQGNSQAQNNLGFMYRDGKGVAKDSREAAKWLRRAAEQGQPMAQSCLGFMYVNGEGVVKNSNEAAKWFRKAAEQGDADAQHNLGLMYAKGIGVPKDEIEGLAWFGLAAASGHEGARHDRAILEQRLGQQISLRSQQRSKEILKEIEIAKTKVAHSSDSPDKGTNGKPKQSGSGVFVNADGLILTAAHVIEGTSSLRIQTSQGIKPARLIRIDTANDLALLKCEGTFQPAPVKSSRGIKLGHEVFTIGFPNVALQGISPKMTRGEISSIAGIQDDPRQWQISVPVQPGNSGGPLFDEAGNVVGVVVAKLNAAKAAKYTGALPENVNYAVKASYALPMLEPYGEKMATENKSLPSDKLETIVERAQDSVVLIWGY